MPEAQSPDDVTPMLDALVSRMLETDPSARPSSMQEVLELLQEAARDGMRGMLASDLFAPLRRRANPC